MQDQTGPCKTSPSIAQRVLARIARLYPFYSGTARLANHPTFKRISGPANVEGWARTPGGEVHVKLDDLVGRTAFFFGDFDRKLTWVAKQILRPGDTAFDIGANVGVMTLLFSALVGSKGAVHAFEPNPEIMFRLKLARERRGANNIVLQEAAIGRNNIMLTLRVPNGNLGGGSVVRDFEWGNCKAYEVPVLRLDDYVDRFKIRDIALMKVDVEGAELDLFAGAVNVLTKMRPRALLFEDNDRSDGKMSSAMEFLQSLGYRFLSIPRCFARMRTTIVDPRAEIVGHDFVAAYNGRQFETLCSLLRASSWRIPTM